MTSFYDPRIRQVLAAQRWQVLPGNFVLVGIDPRERQVVLRLLPGLLGQFQQILIEPTVITLFLAEADWRGIQAAFPHAEVERGFRVIDFREDLPADLVGFLAALSDALAAAGVPILAACGYQRDYLIVRDKHLPAALAALQQLATLMD